MSQPLAVRASGLVTALGYNAPATLAALRAGVSGISTDVFADRQGGKPYRCARVSLPQRWAGVALLADLLAPALHECLQAAPGLTLADIPLLVGVSHPDRPGRPEGLEEQLLPLLAARLEGGLHPCSRVYPIGHAGCAQALLDACRLVQAGRARQVLVAGVDSYVDRETLEAFDERRRLLCSGTFNGFLAGEAGAAVLVSAPDGEEGLPCIVGLAQAMEAARIDHTEPLRAEGLTQAIRGALVAAGCKMSDIDLRLNDLSGEHYKFKEAMFAAIRLDRSPRARPLPMWHPIEYLGETGAAILPCLLAWGAHAMREGYAPGRWALCHVGSDSGERAALVMKAG